MNSMWLIVNSTADLGIGQFILSSAQKIQIKILIKTVWKKKNEIKM